MTTLLVLTLGCTGEMSNELFLDDANFLSALPESSRQTMSLAEDTTDEAARGLGERADLVDLSVLVAADVNAFVLRTLGLIDAVRDLPPTERTEDGRRWGPYDGDCGVSASLLMAREFGVYSWSVLGHPAEGDDATVLYGTHYAGTSVAGGDGTFVWDQSRWAAWCGEASTGLLTVDYDNREGVDLLVDVADWSDDGVDPQGWTYAYARTDEEGDFQFRTVTDLADDGSDELAIVTVRDRWEPAGGGRSDAVVTGGGFGGQSWRWSQCWGPGGRLTFQEDSLGLVEQVGDVEDCRYADAAEVDRL